jgi:hypothetical protein
MQRMTRVQALLETLDLLLDEEVAQGAHNATEWKRVDEVRDSVAQSKRIVEMLNAGAYQPTRERGPRG